METLASDEQYSEPKLAFGNWGMRMSLESERQVEVNYWRKRLQKTEQDQN